MKKLITIVSIIFFSVSFCACDKFIEASNNGRLDGQWYLISIDSLTIGKSVDMRIDRKFMSVQGKILTLRDVDEYQEYLFRFSYGNNQLRLYDARLNDREHGDPVLNSIEMLKPFGVNSLNETFKVNFVNNGKLELSTDQLKLTFRKF